MVTRLKFQKESVFENESIFQKIQQFFRLRYLCPLKKSAKSEDNPLNVVRPEWSFRRVNRSTPLEGL